MARAIASPTSVQNQILAQLQALSAQVAAQGYEYASQIRLLRSELGLNGDGVHGRLPALESAGSALKLSVEKVEVRCTALELRGSEATGGERLKQTMLSLLGGSASGAVIGALVAHWMGK
jgi:hypothetical protein